jgi:Kef-type K+ transport system membrane component KefB
MLLVLTYCVLVFKFLICSGVLASLLGRKNKATWAVAFGLAQISEFSFVLSSRARRLKLLSREVMGCVAVRVDYAVRGNCCRHICSY